MNAPVRGGTCPSSTYDIIIEFKNQCRCQRPPFRCKSVKHLANEGQYLRKPVKAAKASSTNGLDKKWKDAMALRTGRGMGYLVFESETLMERCRVRVHRPLAGATVPGDDGGRGRGRGRGRTPRSVTVEQ
jgi:hypothetical protein